MPALARAALRPACNVDSAARNSRPLISSGQQPSRHRGVIGGESAGADLAVGMQHARKRGEHWAGAQRVRDDPIFRIGGVGMRRHCRATDRGPDHRCRRPSGRASHTPANLSRPRSSPEGGALLCRQRCCKVARNVVPRGGVKQIASSDELLECLRPQHRDALQVERPCEQERPIGLNEAQNGA